MEAFASKHLDPTEEDKPLTRVLEMILVNRKTDRPVMATGVLRGY